MNKSYKIAIFFIVNLLSFYNAFSQQTGISTKAPATSAILDVNTIQKVGGVLMPRVALLHNTDQITITTPAKGLTVFNLQDAGIYPFNVEKNRYYSWDGGKWIDLSDMDLVRRLLLPQVFFSQTDVQQLIAGTDLTTVNSGGEVVVTFANNSVMINNGGHISLSSNIFNINTAGTYEVSGYIGYIPRISHLYNDPITTQTNLEYRFQISRSSGAWTTFGSATAVWGVTTGQYSRTLIIPPLSIENVLVGDRLRVVISKTWGLAHGSGSASSVAIRSPEGTDIVKSMKILKVK